MNSSSPQVVPVIILGTDATLAALPATPVQLAHACLRAGYANVIPASWGDELIAEASLRRLSEHVPGPAIQCSCPIVAHRLLNVGGDLRPVLLTLVPPPVAVARYVRAFSEPTRTRITYVGGCPGAIDDAIDIRMSPAALLSLLLERGIVPEEQPRMFESVIPPDRRRFRSQPGGLPTIDALWSEHGGHTLVEIASDDLAAEITQHLLSGKPMLIDAAVTLGCCCAGAVPGVEPREVRSRVTALEPPHSPTPVVRERASLDLDLPIPAAARAPVDVIAIAETPTAAAPPTAVVAPLTPTTAAPVDAPVASRGSLPETMSATPEPVVESSPESVAEAALEPAATLNVPSRPVLGAMPLTRGANGRSLPRAYLARRRASPRGTAVVAQPVERANDDLSASASSEPGQQRAPFERQTSGSETVLSSEEPTRTAAKEASDVPTTSQPSSAEAGIPEPAAAPNTSAAASERTRGESFAAQVTSPPRTASNTPTPAPASKRRRVTIVLVIALVVLAVVASAAIGITIGRTLALRAADATPTR